MNILEAEYEDDAPASPNRPDECMTCHRHLERGTEVAFPCGHAFCQRCSLRFVHDTRDRSCPVCAEEREEVVPGQDPRPEIHPPSGNQELLVRRAVPNRDPVCAICYAPARDKRRGRIHCCDHYFCFDCIYEAALISPFCPTCRRAFYQIQSEYPPNMRLTRGVTRHNAIFDLSDNRWVNDTERGTLDVAPDIVFTFTDEHGVERNSPCGLCGEGGFLRMCPTCFRIIHYVCADPIWNRFEQRWECALCTRLPR